MKTLKRKKVVVLGSTGSIGKNSLDVIRRNPDAFRVLGLAANCNVDLMTSQIRAFSPNVVAMGDTPSALRLQKIVSRMPKKPMVWNHAHGLEKLAGLKGSDFVLSGLVGSKGLLPLVAALKAGKTIGLANKEALVMAGEIIMNLSKKHKAPVIPVDSEHSAIWQCLEGQNHGDIEKIILTASGGPFYRRENDLDTITVDQALNHPTWKMGQKITIDSATLMNKGLEAIEAHYLFNIPMDKISILIHPQSIVHSMVEFKDGAVLAQLSNPDMRLPIQYALTYPQRCGTPIKRLSLEEIERLEFAKPDFRRFPCLKLALDAGRRGGTAPVVLSASNEEAVKAFIHNRVSFMTIPKIVEGVLKKHKFMRKPTLTQICQCDLWAKEEAKKMIQRREKLKR